MTRSTARDVERRLKDTPAGEPPADLLARLHGDIPPLLEPAPEPPRSAGRRLPPPWLRAAAVVVLALGGAWMLWRLSDAVLAPQAAVEEARGAAQTAGPAFEPGDARGPADAAAAGEGFADEEAGGGGESAASEPRGVAAGGGASDARESGAGRSPAMSSPATASEEAVQAGGADVAQRSDADAGDRPGGPARRAEQRSATRPAAPTRPPSTTATPSADREPAGTPSGSARSDRRVDVEAERPQALADESAATGEGVAVTAEAADLAGDVAADDQASKLAGSASSTAAAGAGRSALASPPVPPAVAASPAPAPAKADEPAPLERPFPDESRVHSVPDSADDRRSTFALHVGTGSWDLVRASLRRGELPPAAAVRVEEVVNALDDGGPPPEQGESFRVTAEGTPSPFAPGPGDRLLRFGIRARTTGPAGPVAEDARVQVDFDPRVVASWRLLGDDDGRLGNRGLRHEAEVAGEIGAGHAVTALYEVRIAGAPAPGHALAHLKLRYRVPGSDRFSEIERTLRVADLSPTWDEAPPSLRLAAVAAELAEQLRGSEHAAGADPVDLARLARAAAADFPGDERAAELAEMAARAARLPAATAQGLRE